jgi:hypothetical protein
MAKIIEEIDLTKPIPKIAPYIDHVVYLNRIDSHHYPNEHIILYVFRAPRYNSIVSLS